MVDDEINDEAAAGGRRFGERAAELTEQQDGPSPGLVEVRIRSSAAHSTDSDSPAETVCRVLPLMPGAR
jgi:hypothetical protein